MIPDINYKGSQVENWKKSKWSLKLGGKIKSINIKYTIKDQGAGNKKGRFELLLVSPKPEN